MSYFRPEIDKMSGYVPGEQPKGRVLVKLNTNENPYPPSPKVKEALTNFDYKRLRLYPDPIGSKLRKEIAELYDFSPDNIILGNGSDDILTMAVRSFAGSGDTIAYVDPTYSLYHVLADIQGVKCIEIALNDDFSLPGDLAEKAEGAKLFLIPRPNAPTGNSFPMEAMDELCENFDGIVLIDEAYADFAQDNCISLAMKYSNVVVSRTFSKSMSLAGVRFGYAIAQSEIISGMMKVKDSYNVNFLTQELALAALKDQDYLKATVAKIIVSREKLTIGLTNMGFEVLPSESNFVFASPPDSAEKFFDYLRSNDILVRYFPGERTGEYVRITVGTEEEVNILLDTCRKKYQ